MIINSHILSIPPYISTSWKNILSIHSQKDTLLGQTLVVTLTTHVIEIPNLDQMTIEKIFETHAHFLDNETNQIKNPESKMATLSTAPPASFSFGVPFKLKDNETALNPFGSMMQHNPDEANAPDLPAEMLSKVSAISKAIGLDRQVDHMPKAEPHCNCPYCQVTRALCGETKQEDVEEESIKEEDLSFKEFDIQNIDKDLYEVTNPLDKDEKYQVFLGNPLGCTCGSKNCEHIKAVLKS